MRYLKPIRLKRSYYLDVEKTINEIFYIYCFAPIIKAFKDSRRKNPLIQNSNDPISTALRRGKIFFSEGKFTGVWDAKLTSEFRRLGATFNRLDKSWKLDLIPPFLQSTIADISIRLEKIKADILTNLANVNLDKNVLQQKINAEYVKTVQKINQDFLESIKEVSIAPELTPEMQHNIAKAWGKNLELYIKDWSEKNILKLREEIATNTYHGNRAESFIKNIQKDYGVSRRKAKFLARQETSLLMSELRKERYKDAGITKYKWSGTMDERERPDHKLLEDTLQTWDNPPIVDRKTGRRAHPGQDYGCRCVAIAIVT
jgi:SPP1 gp7 family putative phage head morphogenesis protein